MENLIEVRITAEQEQKAKALFKTFVESNKGMGTNLVNFFECDVDVFMGDYLERFITFVRNEAIASVPKLSILNTSDVPINYNSPFNAIE